MIASLTAENDNVMSALNTTESRLNEMYVDQARMEEEMAARIEVSEKLRAQVRELEREKRDLQRRYNEQVRFYLFSHFIHTWMIVDINIRGRATSIL